MYHAGQQANIIFQYRFANYPKRMSCQPSGVPCPSSLRQTSYVCQRVGDVDRDVAATSDTDTLSRRRRRDLNLSMNPPVSTESREKKKDPIKTQVQAPPRASARQDDDERAARRDTGSADSLRVETREGNLRENPIAKCRQFFTSGDRPRSLMDQYYLQFPITVSQPI